MWAGRVRDLPDLVGYADFAAQPELAYERVRARIATGRYPMPPALFPLPKPDGDVRRLTWLDPYDDLIARSLFGRVSSSVRKALVGSDAYSYPLVRVGPNWRCLPASVANRQRKARGREFLADLRCAGLGTFDVTTYYPSIDLERLARQLISIGAPGGAVSALIGTFDALAQLGGAPGLPIGFEGSGPLGSLYLLPADQVAAGSRVGLVRYTDDTWLFLRRSADWDASVHEYTSLLRTLGLQINLKKTHFYEDPWDMPEEVITNGALDSMTHGDSRAVPPDEALELLTEEIDAGASSGTLIRFALGVLRTAKDERGLRVLEETPQLLYAEPRAAGDFLVAMADDSSRRNAIDRDWLVGIAADDSGQGVHLAGRLHALRAASRLHLGKSHGSPLADLASGRGTGGRIPLRSWSALAWARSDDWKPGKALDLATSEGTFAVRRAVVLGFRNRDAERWTPQLRQLERLEPDIRPSVEYVVASS